MKKTVCEVNFIRENGQQLMKFKTRPEIEDIFRTDTIEVSKVYSNEKKEGLEFYTLTAKLDTLITAYNQKRTHNYGVTLKEYGNDLMVGDKCNFSFIRSKGVGEGIVIVIGGLILDQEIKDWVMTLGHFLNFIYKNFVERSEVKATLTIEITD